MEELYSESESEYHGESESNCSYPDRGDLSDDPLEAEDGYSGFDSDPFLSGGPSAAVCSDYTGLV